MQTETRWLLFSTTTFFTGLVLGLSTGVLCAPQLGTRTQQKLKNMAADAAERVEDWADATKQTMRDKVKGGKNIVESSVNLFEQGAVASDCLSGA